MTSIQWDAIAISLKNTITGFRWFGGKSRTIRTIRFVKKIKFSATPLTYLCIIEVAYTEGRPEKYVLPLAFEADSPDSVSARPFPHDAFTEESFRLALFDRIFKNTAGLSPKFRNKTPLHPKTTRLLRTEQSNTSVIYGNKYILKFFRRLAAGDNPDIEVGRFLTDQTQFKHSPSVIGALKLGSKTTLAALYEFIPNEGDAWSLFLKLLKSQSKQSGYPVPQGEALQISSRSIPKAAARHFGPTLALAELLGRRTFELHQALATQTRDPAFRLDRISRRSSLALAAQAKKHCQLSFHVLGHNMSRLGATEKKAALSLLEQQDSIIQKLQHLAHASRSFPISRIHGDFHLGQVLFNGKDFFIIDFEGEPARPLKERRQKYTPLRDVAGMLRSFHYASHVAQTESHTTEPSQKTWYSAWYQWASSAYLRGYFGSTRNAPFLPASSAQRKQLLDFYLMEKALYELVYELNNRPDWVSVPLAGINELNAN